MKLLFLLVAILPATLFADLRVPSSVFTMAQLEEAKAKATEKEEALIFLYTDPVSTWGPCLATSVEALKVFRSRGTMVYFNVRKDDWSKLPPGAKAVRKDTGSTLPMIFVTTSDGNNGIKGIPYTSLKSDARKSARDLAQQLETTSVVSTGVDTVDQKEAPAVTTVTELGLLSGQQNWTNAEGNTMVAAVQAYDEVSVLFVLPNKNVVEYPLANLSIESRTTILGLK